MPHRLPHGNKFHHVKRLKFNLQRVEASFSISQLSLFDHLSISEVNDYCKDFGVTNIEKIYIGAAQVGNLVELVKDRDLLVARGTMNIYICHKGEVFFKITHVTNESFETTCNEVDRPTKNLPTKLVKKMTTETQMKLKMNLSFLVKMKIQRKMSDKDGYGSDIHEELSLVKKDLKAYLKKKKEPRKKKIAECFMGEVGIDPDFEDIDKPKKDLTDKLVGDEPFYDSSDADSFESESEGEIDVERSDILRVRKKDKRVSYDPTWKKVVWQLNMVFENVKKFRKALRKYAIERGYQLDKIHNDQRRVRVKCKANGYPWILYASKDFKSSDFIIKTTILDLSVIGPIL
ncbi:hypothetical protein KY289_002484 [Solanum tuberosum]|nr:hypothetical protein KY289_002484 [Solanum tuberosum]